VKIERVIIVHIITIFISPQAIMKPIFLFVILVTLPAYIKSYPATELALTSKLCNSEGLLADECVSALRKDYQSFCSKNQFNALCHSYDGFVGYVLEIESDISQNCFANIAKVKRVCQNLKEAAGDDFLASGKECFAMIKKILVQCWQKDVLHEEQMDIYIDWVLA
jgi:hypothetical protein